MVASHYTDNENTLGRELTADVATLAIAMPVIAHNAFYQVVLPFVFVVSIALVVLFATPFRDVPFIAQHATTELSGLRLVLLIAALGNLALPGYTSVEALGFRWITVAGLAVLGLTVLLIDMRRVFPS